MSRHENVFYRNSQVTQVPEYHKGAAAPALFERYRISGSDRDAFVAALIGRLCLLEVQSRINRGGS